MEDEIIEHKHEENITKEELDYIMTIYDDINMLVRRMEADLNEKKMTTNEFNAITKHLKSAKKAIEEMKKKDKQETEGGNYGRAE